MIKSDIKVLIVEDDANLGKALLEAVKKSGYSAQLVSKPDDALAINKLQVIHAYIIDLLLPKTPGIDLAKKLRDEGAVSTPIILTSGIFKDKSFIKEAISKTNATAFLEKPFDLSELTRALDQALESLVDEPLDPSQELLISPLATPSEKLSLIKKITQLSGLDLPRIMSTLLNSSAMGTLSIKNVENQKTSQVSFASGMIVKVLVDDPQSFFGALLVEKGVLSSAELELALSTPSHKKVGERLIDANLLSPHMVAVVNSEQMAIRLSRLVEDTLYEIFWVDETQNIGESRIESTLWYQFCYDWVNSKLSLKWLESFYQLFMTRGFVRTPHWDDSHSVFQLPLFTELDGFKEKFAPSNTIQAILNEGINSAEKVFEAIHLLVMSGMIAFDKSVKILDPAAQLKRLETISKEMKFKNHFEVLGISSKAKTPEIKKTYHELAKVFHPDKLPPGADLKVVNLTREIFSKMTTAYETLTNEQSKANYLKELQQGQAEKVLQSEALLEEAKGLIKALNFSKALEKLNQAISLRPPSAELLLHVMWVKLSMLSGPTPNTQVLHEVTEMLSKIPPEERHNALYYFVKGLHLKVTGDIAMARRNFEHALSLAPQMVQAQRELLGLKNVKEDKPVDIFRDDLSTVVSALFKKKK